MKNDDDLKFNMRIGNMVRQARMAQNMSQTELAAMVLTGQSAISEIETGQGPTVWLLRRIARALGCRLKIVFERDNYETT